MKLYILYCLCIMYITHSMLYATTGPNEFYENLQKSNDAQYISQAMKSLNLTDDNVRKYIRLFLSDNINNSTFNQTIIKYFTTSYNTYFIQQLGRKLDWMNTPKSTDLIKILQNQSETMNWHGNYDSFFNNLLIIYLLDDQIYIHKITVILKEVIRIFPQLLLARNNNNDTLLHIAANRNSLNLIILLAPYMTKEDIESKNNDNKSAIELTNDPLIQQIIQHYTNPQTPLPHFILDENIYLPDYRFYIAVKEKDYHILSAQACIYALNNHILSVKNYPHITQAWYNMAQGPLPLFFAFIESYGTVPPIDLELFTTALQHGFKVSQKHTYKITDKEFITENALEFARRTQADPTVIALLENAYNQEVIHNLSTHLAVIALI